MSQTWKCAFKDTQRGKIFLNKTQVLTKSTVIDIWVVGALNQLFVKGFSN